MRFTLDGPLLLVGAGKMGGALLSRLLAHGLDPRTVVVQDPEPTGEAADLLAESGIDVLPVVDELSMPPTVILLAVKPQVMEAVLPQVARVAGPDTLYLSIAAGRRIAGLEAKLPAGASVVRAMPNTPAAIGRGVTVAIANAAVTPVQHALAERLLSAGGHVMWVEDEELLDPVTAVSGSGPAYVFLLGRMPRRSGTRRGPRCRACRAPGTPYRHRVGGAARAFRSRRSGPAPERDLARRHDRCGAGDPRRPRWAQEAFDCGGCRRNEARPRTGKVSGAPLESRSRPRVAFRT